MVEGVIRFKNGGWLEFTAESVEHYASNYSRAHDEVVLRLAKLHHYDSKGRDRGCQDLGHVVYGGKDIEIFEVSLRKES